MGSWGFILCSELKRGKKERERESRGTTTKSQTERKAFWILSPVQSALCGAMNKWASQMTLIEHWESLKSRISILISHFISLYLFLVLNFHFFSFPFVSLGLVPKPPRQMEEAPKVPSYSIVSIPRYFDPRYVLISHFVFLIFPPFLPFIFNKK